LIGSAKDLSVKYARLYSTVHDPVHAFSQDEECMETGSYK